MRKKILIGVGVAIVAVVILYTYVMFRSRSLSPSGETSVSSIGMNVSVTYASPSVRGRQIFGTEEEGALLPYGVYWRLGANEPTNLTVDADFVIGETQLKAGSYDLYAFPQPGKLDLRVNSQLNSWGYSEPDYSTEVVQIDLPIMPNDMIEQFTINAIEVEDGVDIVFTWDTSKWILPIRK